MQIAAKYSDIQDWPERKTMLLLGIWCLQCSWMIHAHCMQAAGKIIYSHRVAEAIFSWSFKTDRKKITVFVI